VADCSALGNNSFPEDPFGNQEVHRLNMVSVVSKFSFTFRSSEFQAVFTKVNNPPDPAQDLVVGVGDCSLALRPAGRPLRRVLLLELGVYDPMSMVDRRWMTSFRSAYFHQHSGRRQITLKRVRYRPFRIEFCDHCCEWLQSVHPGRLRESLTLQSSPLPSSPLRGSTLPDSCLVQRRGSYRRVVSQDYHGTASLCPHLSHEACG
jgi:hypothetical protein